MAGLGALGSHCQREAVSSALTHTYTRACGSLNALQPRAWPFWKAERVEKEEPQQISLLRFFLFAKVILARDLAFFLSQS